MKGKQVHIRLTNSEFAMMQLLWEAGRPLNRAEIMEIALRDGDNPLFANFYWIFAQKKIPELTFMGCHLPTKLPGIF